MRFLTLALLLGLVKSAASAAESAAELRKPLLQEPVAFRVYQRDSGGQSEIPVTLASDLKATLKSAQLTGLPLDARSRFADGKFTGVPTGGPYELNVTVKVGDAERKLSVGPIFVGDLWVLAGQSNMQGVGDLIDVTPPHPKVMSFEMNGRWVRAQEPLHWWLLDPVRQKTNPTGAGLGLPFAVALVQKTKVPIGLLPCAVGGTYMTQWDPAKKSLGRSSLYGAMLDQVKKAGGKVKGMLWYQGEAERDEATFKVYPKVFEAFIAAVREDLHQPDLPFYFVQIGRLVAVENARGWKAVQETQRLLPERVPNTAVISVIDLELDDFIHVGTQGLKRAGERLALIALGKLYGQAEATTPDLDKVVKGPGRSLLVKFKRVNRRKDQEFGLKPARHIAGFSIRRGDDKELPLIFEAAVGPERDTVILRLTGEIPRGAQLWYGYGLNPYCNLTDALDMAVPAFGPIALHRVK
ncbi:MAG TPA: sialate O-acetylesterase [Gemmataceae bacterium]|nr:sialate O-acetylesterase [Gemmataceae bacterium]